MRLIDPVINLVPCVPWWLPLPLCGRWESSAEKGPRAFCQLAWKKLKGQKESSAGEPHPECSGLPLLSPAPSADLSLLKDPLLMSAVLLTHPEGVDLTLSCPDGDLTPHSCNHCIFLTLRPSPETPGRPVQTFSSSPLCP